MSLNRKLTRHTAKFIPDTDTPDVHDDLQHITFHDEHDRPVNIPKAYYTEGGEGPRDFTQM